LEAEIVSLPNTNGRIELNSLIDQLGELPQDQDIVIYCRTGVRSMTAAHAIKNAGFNQAILNLTGGIHAWSDLVDSSVPKY